ncbi:hypothetical protein D3C72_2526610 [compost metagenome]
MVWCVGGARRGFRLDVREGDDALAGKIRMHHDQPLFLEITEKATGAARRMGTIGLGDLLI